MLGIVRKNRGYTYVSCIIICGLLGLINILVNLFFINRYNIDIYSLIESHGIEKIQNISTNQFNNNNVNDTHIKLISSLQEMYPKWSLNNTKYSFMLNSYNEYYLNCESNTDYSVTLISALILIDETAINGTSPDKEPQHQYTKTIINLLQNAYQPLILFISNNVENNKKLFNKIISIRQQKKYPPTIIISIDIKDTEYYPYIKQKELQYNFSIGDELQLTKCTVWNEKIVFLKNTVLRNPFNSQYFFWLDAGILRYADNPEQFKQFPIQNRLNLLNNNKFFFGTRKRLTCD